MNTYFDALNGRIITNQKEGIILPMLATQTTEQLLAVPFTGVQTLDWNAYRLELVRLSPCMVPLPERYGKHVGPIGARDWIAVCRNMDRETMLIHEDLIEDSPFLAGPLPRPSLVIGMFELVQAACWRLPKELNTQTFEYHFAKKCKGGGLVEEKGAGTMELWRDKDHKYLIKKQYKKC